MIQTADNDKIRLNRFIANSGVCARREADRLIASGRISVNGIVVKAMGLKITPVSDVVMYKEKRLCGERPVYILLNKPKDCITTASDPQKRHTVFDYIKNASESRVYPVGRLDRNTTGVLLFTNDGDLTMRLTHPSNEVKKKYHIVVDKEIKEDDFQSMLAGIVLEDGAAKFDSCEYTGGGGGNEINVETHSGKNRIVRRMVEHLGYKVIRLDRVMFAGLTKKGLQRGRWRILSEQEIGMVYRMCNFLSPISRL